MCAPKKQSGVHTQPWLCKWEINRVSWVEPPNLNVIDVLAVFTLNTSCVCHKLCWYTRQTNAVHYSCKFEGALKRGGFVWLLSSNIKQAFSRIIDYTFENKTYQWWMMCVPLLFSVVSQAPVESWCVSTYRAKLHFLPSPGSCTLTMTMDIKCALTWPVCVALCCGNIRHGEA